MATAQIGRASLMMAMAAMADPRAVAADVAKRLNVTTITLYGYVNGSGSRHTTRRIARFTS